MARIYVASPQASNAGTYVATGTSLKTILQVATPSTTGITVKGWWVSFTGVASTDTPIKVELGEYDVAATVTALSPTKYSEPDGLASLCVSGTSATGYNASAEGSITTSRILDFQAVHAQSGVYIQYPLGNEPKVVQSKFLRIRVTAAVSVNAACGIIFEE